MEILVFFIYRINAVFNETNNNIILMGNVIRLQVSHCVSLNSLYDFNY